MSPRALHPRHRIDIEPPALARALAACARTPRGATGALERAASPDGEVIAALSARSGFDLMLSALALAPGDEVILSGWTIPDMARIARAHGLVPVPLDCDPATLAPSPEELSRVISARSRVLVVAQLFGASVDLAPLAAVAHARGLVVVDDDAQGFTGPARLAGSPSADVVLHSFGTIKTATALGGALVRVRDEALRATMRSLMRSWPAQPAARYAKKLSTYLALALPRHPRRYAGFARAVGAAGRDLDAVLTGLTKGFPAETPEALQRAIRWRPCEALSATLARRIERFDHARVGRRRDAGERMLARLTPEVTVLGASMPARTHWLFAVCVADPDGLVRSLRREGFDAARGTSTLAAVPTAPERPDARADRCASWRERVAFLPAYPEVPERDRDRMADAVRRHVAGEA